MHAKRACRRRCQRVFQASLQSFQFREYTGLVQCPTFLALNEKLAQLWSKARIRRHYVKD